EPGDEAERDRLGLGRAGAEHQKRGELLARPCVRAGILVRDLGGGALGGAKAFAMPLGSMIMITAPSPKMVLPENMSMGRSFGDIGLTTIFSGGTTPHTQT